MVLKAGDFKEDTFSFAFVCLFCIDVFGFGFKLNGRWCGKITEIQKTVYRNAGSLLRALLSAH